MDDRKRFIPDASVLLKWIVKEDDCDGEAQRLLSDFQNHKIDLSVPAHCFIEIANMLGREKKEVTLSLLSFLMMAGIEENMITIETATIAFSLMKKYGTISFYDAFYHALAIHENAVFITADTKYIRTTHKEKHILHLKDYPLSA